MNEPREDRPVADRAGALGEQVGRLTIRALRGIENIAKDGIPSQASAQRTETSEPAAETTRSATERAEKVVDGVEQQLGHFAAFAGMGIRKFAALAQEEAEDIWAEAQHIRRSNRLDTSEARESQPAQPD